MKHNLLCYAFFVLVLSGCDQLDGEGGRDNALQAPDNYGPEYSEAERAKMAEDATNETVAPDGQDVVAETLVFRGQSAQLSDKAKSAIQGVAQQVAEGEKANVFIRAINPNDVTSKSLGDKTQARVHEVKGFLEGQGVDVANYTLNRYSSREYHSLLGGDPQQANGQHGLSKRELPEGAKEADGTTVVLTIIELDDV